MRVRARSFPWVTAAMWPTSHSLNLGDLRFDVFPLEHAVMKHTKDSRSNVEMHCIIHAPEVSSGHYPNDIPNAGNKPIWLHSALAALFNTQQREYLQKSLIAITLFSPRTA